MGLGTATIKMESTEAYRERLHDLVKATRSVLVLVSGDDDQIVGQPMVVLRTGDDTTMHVASALGAAQRAALSGGRRVAVVVPGTGCAMFDAEATISRDHRLLDALLPEAWRLWGRGKSDPSITMLVISPIEGAYWDGAHRRAYRYRPAPPPAAREVSDGVPVPVAPV